MKAQPVRMHTNLKAALPKNKNSRRALDDRQEQMEVVLSALNTGLALINPDLTIAWVNAETEKILPWEELVGRVCYKAAAQLDEPCEGCGALLAFADGQIHKTFRQSPVDGKWHLIVSIPVKDSSGATVQVIESVTDITEIKQTEQDLAKAIEEMARLKSLLEEENIYLKEEIKTAEGFDGAIGQSNSFIYVMSKVKQVSKTDSTVLIQGETGVGKEVVARAIHQASDRSDKPFIKLNCPSMPTHVLESELFGHEAGAFTGAGKRRRGRFEMADGGTIFLDEISEIPMDFQAKLLGVLQEKKFERVGSSKTISVDVRIIAATNRVLTDEVKAGRFRTDLYYRLNIFPITVPPLRDRSEDIPLLVEHFVSMFAAQNGTSIDCVAKSAMDTLMAYHWPGNIRELRNILERACITCPGSKLTLPRSFECEALKPDGQDTAPDACTPDNLPTLKQLESSHILKALKLTDWRISGKTGAAAILDINPSTLRNRMKKLKIKRA